MKNPEIGPKNEKSEEAKVLVESLISEIDPTQKGLSELKITQSIIAEKDVFTEAQEINAGEVKTSKNAFNYANGCQVKRVKAGALAFFYAEDCQAERAEAGMGAFWSAKDCQVERVIAESAFSHAKNCQAERVEVGMGAFWRAKDCQARIVEAEEEAFSYANRCRAGTVKGKRAFFYAEDCQAERVEAGMDAFWGAKDCQVERVITENAFKVANGCQVRIVEVEEGAFSYANRCRAGTVKGKRAFFYVKDCQAERVIAENAFESANGCRAGTVEVEEGAFNYAKNCLCLGGIEAEEIGINSRGVVVLGEIKGKIYPSVISMDGKVKNSKEEIEDFFKKEYKKSQQGQETIFDYLSFYNWEGKTLEEGKKILKKRYSKTKDGLKEIRGHKFYFLIEDNSKREEIFPAFKKLRKVEKNTFNDLNDYFSQFEKIKEYLPLLSLKDWVGLAQYSEFLDFKDAEKEIKKIEKNFEEINLESVLKKPEEYELKIAKKIKKLRGKRVEIDQEELKKIFQKEKKDKENHLIREILLKSPKKNIITKYNKRFKPEKKITEEKITEDIIFVTRLYEILGNKVEEKNKEILEKLVQGERPLDWEKNRDWIESMKEKIDTKAWLEPFSKEYDAVKSEDYKVSLKNGQKIEIEEIIEHFKETGIKISETEIGIKEIEEILLENESKIPPDIKKDIKTHIRAFYSLKGIEKSNLPSKIILETEEDPLKTIQMGQKVIGSCLRLKGGHEESAVCNAVDINKKIIWAKDKRGNILGRILIGINDRGELNGFRIYSNDPRIDLNSSFEDFLSCLAKRLNTKLTSEGKIEELIGENWHDDGVQKWEKL